VLASISLEKSTWYQSFGEGRNIDITLEETLH